MSNEPEPLTEEELDHLEARACAWGTVLDYVQEADVRRLVAEVRRRRGLLALHHSTEPITEQHGGVRLTYRAGCRICAGSPPGRPES